MFYIVSLKCVIISLTHFFLLALSVILFPSFFFREINFDIKIFLGFKPANDITGKRVWTFLKPLKILPSFSQKCYEIYTIKYRA